MSRCTVVVFGRTFIIGGSPRQKATRPHLANSSSLNDAPKADHAAIGAADGAGDGGGGGGGEGE